MLDKSKIFKKPEVRAKTPEPDDGYKQLLMVEYETVCPNCRKLIKIMIPATGSEKRNILDNRMRKLLSQRNEIEKKINETQELMMEGY